ncbi:hypothetical protein O181_066205 [Austropuccinia psidii MF-1]|uniref:Uncharacterized protein n=1 Tax=Austropuccinia psidii MF-1 TaxID=1389203 RepID=A0A9Q3EWM2_9BASI|nr:hypothetical protein [Austropuccinia psidii MF-1]
MSYAKGMPRFIREGTRTTTDTTCICMMILPLSSPGGFLPLTRPHASGSTNDIIHPVVVISPLSNFLSSSSLFGNTFSISQNFTYIKAMELCKCRKCSTHTWINSSGTTQKGQLLSSRNKRKHKRNDYFQSTASIIHQKYKQASYLLVSTTDGSETEESNDDMSIPLDLEAQNNLTVIVSIFICWIHLICSCSLETCCIVHQFIIAIVAAAQRDNRPDPQFPKDF